MREEEERVAREEMERRNTQARAKRAMDEEKVSQCLACTAVSAAFDVDSAVSGRNDVCSKQGLSSSRIGVNVFVGVTGQSRRSEERRPGERKRGYVPPLLGSTRINLLQMMQSGRCKRGKSSGERTSIVSRGSS